MIKFTRNGVNLTEAIWRDKLTDAIDFRALVKYGSPDRRSLQGRFIIISIDIDNFKSINDNFGHQKGDEVLAELSKHLQSVFHRRSDAFIARYGGDEFAVLLPNCSVKFAELGMKKVQGLLEPTKVSFGVERCESFSEILSPLAEADGKMYQMKAQAKS